MCMFKYSFTCDFLCYMHKVWYFSYFVQKDLQDGYNQLKGLCSLISYCPSMLDGNVEL